MDRSTEYVILPFMLLDRIAAGGADSTRLLIWQINVK